MAKVFEVQFKDLKGSLFKLFESTRIKEILKEKEKIILKPNLTTNIPYPVTTDPKFVEVILEIILSFHKGQIFIAEGSGGCDTKEAFKKLGYENLAKKFGVKLIDLNREERVKVKNEKSLKLKEIWFPKILLDSYLISLPLPKEHGEAIFTCALKNQFGIYLSKDFVMEYDKEKLEKMGVFVAKEIWERGWNKGELHSVGIHESIFDLNLYKKPDFVICDARVGIKGGELGGKEFKIGKIIASFDPVALDSYLARIFGFDWKKIKYLRLANKVLGEAENFEIVKL